MELRIRPELEPEIEKIAEILKVAFHQHPYSKHTEHIIVHDLRYDHALALSLVAEVEGELVGHIAFSEVEISDGSTGWLCLGPLAVIPTKQGEGLDRLKRDIRKTYC